MRLLPTSRRSFSARPSSTHSRPNHRLAMEPLEDRLCMSYSPIDLGTLGGTSSSASAVNVSGQVVGGSDTATGDRHAFLWQNGTMTDLGTLGGPRSFALDINDAGQVVGSSWPSVEPESRAFLWQSGIMTDLGTLGGDFSIAQAINNHGQIVGRSRTVGGATHSFVWENGVMYDLDNLLPANSGWLTTVDTIDINDNGQIAGTGLINGQKHAFRLTDNDGIFANGGAVIVDLGALSTGSSSAYGINNLGQAVGGSYAGDANNGNTHAVRFSDGVVTDLKTLVGNRTLGENSSNAYAINDAGQIVGDSSTTTWNVRHAFLWQNGKMTDLNKQLPRRSPWELEAANDIDAVGRIVGYGMVGGQRHAFLMIPSGSALQAVAVGAASEAEALSLDQAQPLLTEALARWQAAGADTSGLNDVTIAIADLGGTTLGLAFGNTITLDDNAAGWGWFVDTTPNNDFEFTKAGNQGEQRRIDLLTVVMHELGHLLGRDHDTDGVMAETLAAGVRRTDLENDNAALADQVVGQLDDDRPDAWLGAR